MEQDGFLEDIVVTPDGENTWRIISGHRRVMAAELSPPPPKPAPAANPLRTVDSFGRAIRRSTAQLKALDIPFEAHILSAHRTPAEAADFAKNARANGFGVILCAAGMAAHLAGAFAANTTLPVIGIPMKGGAMDGLDALLATVQMPSGIPVATVALNGAKNAAWLAAEILALSDDTLAGKLEAERVSMAQQIAAKEEKLQNELKEL